MGVVKLQAKRSGARYTSYVVTIPAKIIQHLGWKEGDMLQVEIGEKSGKKAVIITKLE